MVDTPTTYADLQALLSNFGKTQTPSAVNPTGAPDFGASDSTETPTSTGSTGLGLNTGTFGLGLNALGTIGGLYSGISALSLANKQYQLQKTLANANLNNSIKSYNTDLNDRISSRAVAENQGQDYVNNYMKQNSLSR